jgi:hypothetical protein
MHNGKRENIKPEQMWEAENEFRKTLIQVFGGLVVIAGLFFAYQELRNFQIAQENMKAGQVATRFSKAIELLSKVKDTTARKGGIYALEQIAREVPENYLGTVIELLSDFVRNAEVDVIKEDEKMAEEKKLAYGKRGEDYKIKRETQIAMTVLGRIRTEDNKKHWEYLPRINLHNVKLKGVNLKRADLTGARKLKVGQLLKVKTLYKVKGLTPEIEKEIKEKKPELFDRSNLETRTPYQVESLTPDEKKILLKRKKPKLFKDPKKR